MLIATFTSAFSLIPHPTPSNTAWERRLPAETVPQPEQVWLVYAGWHRASAFCSMGRPRPQHRPVQPGRGTNVLPRRIGRALVRAVGCG